MAENENEKVVPKRKTTRKVAVKSAKGTVVGCLALNIRDIPSITGKVVTTVMSGTELTIDKAGSTDDFYKVEQGYCMKEYVEVK